MAQTKPLKQYGGSSKLIGDLKHLLTYGFALAILGGIVDTLLTIVDAPVALLGTFTAANVVAPIATRAANVALADVSWADAIRNAPPGS